MLDRFLAFGLTIDQERSFRRAELPAEAARARLVLALTAVPVVAFAANDHALLGLTGRFYALAALRLGFLGWTLAVIAALKRFATPRAYDRACLAWGLGLVSVVCAINATRPHASVSHLIMAMALVFLLCLALPIPFSHQVLLCFAVTAGEGAVLGYALRGSPRALLGSLLGLALMSGLAALSGWQVHVHRRREFLVREALRAANDRLEREVLERTAELRRAVDELDGFFALSPDLLCITDLQGRFRRVNRAWEADLGHPVATLAGRLLTDLVHPEDLAASRAALESAGRSAGPVSFSNRCRAADGSYRWFDWSATNAGGALHAVARDATDRRRAEELLRRSQKLEAVGRLAGGVAHNFNNQLTAILGTSEIILEESAGFGPLHEEAADIRDAARRAAALTRQLLTFSRKQVVRPRVLDLAALVAGMEPMLRRLVGEGILVETRAAPSPPLVCADPAQLEQVIVNLVANARDAMPAGGRVTLETATVEVAQVSSDAGLEPGPHVRLTVTDAGTGMTAEVQSHLFEPFFTTKEPGKGTGLGLSTVHGIVKQAGGDVRVRSELGKGSAFDVYLPLAEAVPEAERAEDPGAVAAGTGTVLLVDDEPMVRRLVARLLRDMGCEVLEAAGGEEALGIAGGFRGDIDLLVTDVLMPGMDGPELAKLVRSARPGLEVLFISGCTERGPGAGEPIDPGSVFLQKPFSPTDLGRCVRTLLGARRGPSRSTIPQG